MSGDAGEGLPAAERFPARPCSSVRPMTYAPVGRMIFIEHSPSEKSVDVRLHAPHRRRDVGPGGLKRFEQLPRIDVLVLVDEPVAQARTPRDALCESLRRRSSGSASLRNDA